MQKFGQLDIFCKYIGEKFIIVNNYAIHFSWSINVWVRVITRANVIEKMQILQLNQEKMHGYQYLCVVVVFTVFSYFIKYMRNRFSIDEIKFVYKYVCQ